MIESAWRLNGKGLITVMIILQTDTANSINTGVVLIHKGKNSTLSFSFPFDVRWARWFTTVLTTSTRTLRAWGLNSMTSCIACVN